MNRDLKVALVLDKRPAWRIALEAGVSPTILSRIVTGLREASATEQKALAKVLGLPVSRLFAADDKARTATSEER